MALGWCFRREQRDTVFAGSLGVEALAGSVTCLPSSLGDAPSLSTHGRYSWAKPAFWPNGGPFPPSGICPPPRWWASAPTVVNPQFPACLKKCEFLSPVAQPSPRPFLTHLHFVLRPGRYFRLEGLREAFQPFMALLSQNPGEMQG